MNQRRRDHNAPPLSVVLVTHNEERNIGECLDSVSWAQDIVVVDAFSTDGTVDICRRKGVRIFQEPWKGFAGQRNSAVDKARYTWVLNIDADERITPELRQEIEEVLSSRSSAVGYRIPYRNYFRGSWIRYGGWYPDYHLRLFRKDKGRYVEREIHETVELDGRVDKLKNPLDHIAYRDISSLVRKLDSYSTLMARQYFKERKKAGPWTGLLHGFYTFFSMFFLRRGFLDGGNGLILACLYATYTFLKYAKLMELRQAREGERA